MYNHAFKFEQINSYCGDIYWKLWLLLLSPDETHRGDKIVVAFIGVLYIFIKTITGPLLQVGYLPPYEMQVCIHRTK